MNFWNGAADLKVMILGGTVILLYAGNESNLGRDGFIVLHIYLHESLP